MNLSPVKYCTFMDILNTMSGVIEPPYGCVCRRLCAAHILPTTHRRKGVLARLDGPDAKLPPKRIIICGRIFITKAVLVDIWYAHTAARPHNEKENIYSHHRTKAFYSGHTFGVWHARRARIIAYQPLTLGRARSEILPNKHHIEYKYARNVRNIRSSTE